MELFTFLVLSSFERILGWRHNFIWGVKNRQLSKMRKKVPIVKCSASEFMYFSLIWSIIQRECFQTVQTIIFKIFVYDIDYFLIRLLQRMFLLNLPSNLFVLQSLTCSSWSCGSGEHQCSRWGTRWPLLCRRVPFSLGKGRLSGIRTHSKWNQLCCWGKTR